MVVLIADYQKKIFQNSLYFAVRKKFSFMWEKPSIMKYNGRNYWNKILMIILSTGTCTRVMVLLMMLAYSCRHPAEERIGISELQAPVEVLRDSFGINHIYAETQHDLFFAQGYCAARDRLFQFEIWRRRATGTVAEVLGPRALKRDIGARLFRFQGDIHDELNHYHPDGIQIINSFVDGINAYIREINKTPENLPVEFKLLDIQPGLWTPGVVVSRHQGLLGNITEELAIGRAVARIGVERVKELLWLHPKDPVLALDPAIKGDLLFENILELYNAFREDIIFEPGDIRDHQKGPFMANSSIASPVFQSPVLNNQDRQFKGSNNWVIRGGLTESGFPVMANDPHRTISIPSLRYIAHLVAPGWNVIGGGEPELPGISIGHNMFGAWGLTVFRTDGEDLCVYDLNPANLDQYKYHDHWEEMVLEQDTIRVKGDGKVPVILRYTRHGPVTFIDSVHHKAYAVRCAWLEPGGSPYLASLRMDQARNWEEFREACNYSHIPGENMVWADNKNNIGWQAVGIAPLRKNFSGLVPVPGDGRYEWDGYLPIREKPHLFNPAQGFIATANQNVTPEDYDYWDAIGFLWSDPFRGNRINQILGSGKKLSLEDMKALQTDYFSLPAQTLVPYLHDLSFDSKIEAEAKNILLNWDFILDRNSIAAGIYAEWENTMIETAEDRFIPEEIEGLFSLQLTKIIKWIAGPDEKFGPDPGRGRDQFLKDTFRAAIKSLIGELGEDSRNWLYGQEKYKHVYIRHPLSGALGTRWKPLLDAGPAPRGGNGYTPGATGSNRNQSSGASFRIIADVGDWDKSLAINAPGESGNPRSRFYKNLFDMWANDRYFPLYYSKDRIKKICAEKLLLTPEKKINSPNL